MDQTRNCIYRKKCGACQTLNLSYDEELSLKMKKVIGLLGRFGHIEEIIPSEPSEHYRNKAQYLFRFVSGKTVSGLYRSSDGGIARIGDCLMEDRDISGVLNAARQVIKEKGIRTYDGRKGDLRHVLIRKGIRTGEISVSFITRNGMFEGAEEAADLLIRKCPEVVTVTVIQNSTDIPLWTDGEEKILAGKGYFEDILCGCRFRVPPKAFYQINPYSTEKLYMTASGFADIKDSDNILDAFCGIGTIGITAAKKGCSSLDGFDVSESAVKIAAANAKNNGISNYNYRCMRDSEFMLNGNKRYNVIFTDPPRNGCSRKFISSMIKAKPDKIIYISCSPESLARDLMILKKNNYLPRKIQPVDMFPGTTHVETVVIMTINQEGKKWRI